MAVFLSKIRQNSNEVRMCHDWFKIDNFGLNFAFNYWNISVYLLKKWIYIVRSLCWEITQLTISNFVLTLIRIVYIFKSAMLAHHSFDESQLLLNHGEHNTKSHNVVHFDIHVQINYSIWRVKVNNISSHHCCSATGEQISLISFYALQNETYYTDIWLLARIYSVFGNPRVSDGLFGTAFVLPEIWSNFRNILEVPVYTWKKIWENFENR